MATISIASPTEGSTVSQYVFFASGSVTNAQGLVVTCEILLNGQPDPVATCTPCPIFAETDPLNPGSVPDTVTWAAVFMNLSPMQNATLRAKRIIGGAFDSAAIVGITIANVPPTPGP